MTTPTDRPDVCRRTAAALRESDPSRLRAVLGFDGFVDNILRAVDQRLDAENYNAIPTIAALGGRISGSAGHSSNIELVRVNQKLGGNGPIFANALSVLGMGVIYIGSIGYPRPDPIFADFGRRAVLHGVTEPAVTDALEFDDGKLMLNKNSPLADVNWQNLIDRVGLDVMVASYEQATLIGMANWTMLPHLSDIWKHLLREVMPKLSKKPRTVFVDLADPAKRTTEHLHEAFTLLGEFQKHANVVLGLNRGEARRVADQYKLGVFDSTWPQTEKLASAIRDALGLSTVVIHTRQGAAAATENESASIDGPFVQRPKTTTGAGDHFNSGFALGVSLELGLIESLCCGVAVGGYYVSRAESPTLENLATFVETLPPPEAEA